METSYVKKLIVLIILAVVILTLGVISVDSRQNVVITNMISKKESVLSPGLHFAWPMVERIDYVFMNKRDGLFSTNVVFMDKTKADVSVAIQWQVIDPQKFLSVRDNFHKSLAQKIANIVDTRVNTMDLSTFNQLNDLITEPLVVNDLGILILNISLNQLKIVSINDKMLAESDIESAPIVSSDSSIESAYFAAQMLKINTEIEKDKMYQALSDKESDFYSYFRVLQFYKMNVKKPEDLPPLDQIFK